MADPRGYPRFRSGKPVKLEELQRISDTAEQLDHPSGPRLGYGRSGIHGIDSPPAGIWTRITAKRSSLGTPAHHYGHVEQQGDDTYGWIDKPGGVTGDPDLSPAVESCERDDVPAAPATGPVVWATLGDTGDHWNFTYPGSNAFLAASKRWARIIARQNFAYSWVEAELITPTPGSFATNTGTDFAGKSGGLSGTFNLYERNRHANIPIGMHVEIWANGDDWLCDFELDHFQGKIIAETGGGVYTVEGTQEGDNQRTVMASEFNGTQLIPAGTVVQVWVYKGGQILTYGFEYSRPRGGDTYVDVDISTVDIANVQMGDTVIIANSTTGVVINYIWQCFNFGCGWVNLCTCELVPYWCVDGECVQADEEPDGATGGPFATPTLCAEASCVDPIEEVENCYDAPFYWGLTVSGGTDDFAQFNGSWTMVFQSVAYWTAVKRGILITLTLVGNVATLQMFGIGVQATYTATVGPTCCSPIVFTLDEIGTPPQGDGTPPTSVALDPVSECTLPWWCVASACVQAETEPEGATGGPYVSESECEAADCVPPPVTVACCPDNPLPQTLYASGTTCCSGISGVALPWDAGANGGNGAWVNDSITCGGHTLRLTIFCDSSTWKCNASCDTSDFTRIADVVVCDPLQLEFIFGTALNSLAPCCDSPTTIIITETSP